MTKEHENWCHAEIKKLSVEIERLKAERSELYMDRSRSALEIERLKAERDEWKAKWIALAQASMILRSQNHDT